MRVRFDVILEFEDGLDWWEGIKYDCKYARY